MSFEEDIKKEYNKIQEKNSRLVASKAIELVGVLQEASPVDSGELRLSWLPPEKLGRFSWRISNVAPHALIIDGGRRQVTIQGSPHMIGSEQLPKGYAPVIAEFEIKLQQAVSKV